MTRPQLSLVRRAGPIRTVFPVAALTVAVCLHGGAHAADGGAATAPASGDVASAETRTAPQEEWISIPVPGGRTLRTFVARPANAAASRPTVILVHDNRGLTTLEQEAALDLAANGYTVLVPDLLSQAGPQAGDSASFESVGAARQALAELTPAQIRADLDAAADFAREQAPAAKRVVLGFGFGGAAVFRYAAEDGSLDAAIVFYAPAPNDEQLQQIDVPVFAFYGENDQPLAGEVSKLRLRMEELGKNFQPVIYPAAGRQFMRAGAAPDARPADGKARADAIERLHEILAVL